MLLSAQKRIEVKLYVELYTKYCMLKVLMWGYKELSITTGKCKRFCMHAKRTKADKKVYCVFPSLRQKYT